MDEVKKLLTIISYLKANPSTRYEDLAKFLGESEKEVREDIDKLLMCGVPPYYPTDYICVFDERDSVSIDFVDHFRRPVKLSPSEHVALQMALDEYQSLNPESDDIVKGLRKKLESATANAKNVIDDDNISRNTKFNQTLSKRVSLIKSAIKNKNKTKLEYFHPGTREFSERVFHPYLLVRIKDSIYVKGFCELRNDIRSMKIDRIKNIEILNKIFDLPGEETLNKLAKKPINYIPPRLRSQLQTLKVQFSQQIAPYVEEEWGKKYCKTQPDGSIIYKSPVLDENWVARFILSFGKEARILEPQNVVVKVKSIVENINESLTKHI